MDGFESPFSKEDSETGNPSDWRRAKPAPHLSFVNRPTWQRFEYDWLGNLSESDDNEHGFYDRSLGTQAHGNAYRPYQLSSASNATHASSTGSSGNVTTYYDNAGNLRSLTVARYTVPNTPGKLACLPSGAGCNQYYLYDWDEVGRLVRARRWDSATTFPAASAGTPGSSTPAIDLRYRYDASDQRVIKRVFNTEAASQRHTLYAFGSLEVHRTTYTNNAYLVDNASLVPYAMANGVRLARLHYDLGTTQVVPKVTGLPEEQGGSNTISTGVLHVLFELGDHLGSTGTVLDKVSSELVEQTGYLPFGARENDYRPSRWNGFREDYGFTGKEEDVEVGLTYFGKRYLSPQLGRWVSADPLAVHAAGKADFNLYAYVSGAVLRDVDPVGLAAANEAGGATSRGGSGNEGAPGRPNQSDSASQTEPAGKGQVLVGLVQTKQVSGAKEVLKKAVEMATEKGSAIAAREGGKFALKRVVVAVGVIAVGAAVAAAIFAADLMGPSSEPQRDDASSGMAAAPVDKAQEPPKTQTGGADKPPPGGSGPPASVADEPSSSKIGGGAGNRAVNTGRWNKGSFDSAEFSLNRHFEKHGPEVGAKDAQQYLRKAESFAHNLWGATKSESPVDGAVDGVFRYSKAGRYIDLAPDKSIVSFGAKR